MPDRVIEEYKKNVIRILVFFALFENRATQDATQTQNFKRGRIMARIPDESTGVCTPNPLAQFPIAGASSGTREVCERPHDEYLNCNFTDGELIGSEAHSAFGVGSLVYLIAKKFLDTIGTKLNIPLSPSDIFKEQLDRLKPREIKTDELVVFEHLRYRTDFIDAVSYLNTELGESPENSFKWTLKYLFLRQPMTSGEIKADPNSIDLDRFYGFTSKSSHILFDKYGINYERQEYILNLVAGEIGATDEARTIRETIRMEAMFLDSGFVKAYDYLIREQGFTPESSFKMILRHLIRPTKSQAASENPPQKTPAPILTPYDIRLFLDRRRKNPLSQAQMEAYIFDVAQRNNQLETGKQLIDLVRGIGSVPINDMERLFTDTGRWVVRYGILQLETAIGDARTRLTLSGLREMTAEAERALSATTPIPKTISLSANNSSISIDLSSVPQDARRFRLAQYVQSWRSISDALTQSSSENPEEPSLKELLRQRFPVVGRAREYTGIDIEELIAAHERGEMLVARASAIDSSTSAAIRGMILDLPKMASGIIAYDIEGGNTEIAVLWPSEISTNEGMLVYERGGPQFGPYTFYESKKISIAKDGEVKSEPALAIVDRRGRPDIITLSEMNKLTALQREMEAAARERTIGIEVKRAYQEFYYDLARAWNSVGWKDESAKTASEGFPKGASFELDSLILMRTNRYYELLRTLRQSCQALLDYKPVGNESNLRKAHWKLVHRSIRTIIGKYSNLFEETKARPRFINLMEKLTRELVVGNNNDVLRARAAIKELVFDGMDMTANREGARLTSNLRSVEISNELQGYLAAAEQGLSNTPQEKISELSLMRSGKSIEAAQALYRGQHRAQALQMLWLIANDGETHLPNRMSALTEMFSIARETNDANWMMRSLKELGYLKYQGAKLSATAQHVVEDAFELEALGIIKVPVALRVRGMGAACSLAIDSLVGDAWPAVDIPKHDRPALLTDEGRAELQAAAEAARANGLKQISKAELLRIATLTRAEFELENRGVKQTEAMQAWYDSARRIIRLRRYNSAKLEEIDGVRMLADQPVKRSRTGSPSPDLRSSSPLNEAAEGGEQRAVSEADLLRSLNRWQRVGRGFGNLSDLAGPTLAGLGSFVVAKRAIEGIAPQPTNDLEALALGYDIVGTGIILDRGIGRATEFIVDRMNPPAYGSPISMTRPISTRGFMGGMGEMMVLSRMIAAPAHMMGASENTSDWIGLGGAAAALAAGNHLTAKLGASSALGRGMIATSANLSAAGLVIFVADATLGGSNAIIDLAVDDIDGATRKLEYFNFRDKMMDASLFGENNGGANLGERILWSASAVPDYIMPTSSAAWFMMTSDIGEGIAGNRWREWKRSELRSKTAAAMAAYELNYSMNLAVNELALEFEGIVQESLIESDGASTDDLLSRLSMRYVDCAELEGCRALFRWGKIESTQKGEDDLHWLFKDGAVAEGRIKDKLAIAYYMHDKFDAAFDSMLRALDAQQSIVEGLRGTLKDTISIELIRAEFDARREAIDMHRSGLDMLKRDFLRRYSSST